jgi:hypothetical protein
MLSEEFWHKQASEKGYLMCPLPPHNIQAIGKCYVLIGNLMLVYYISNRILIP